MLRLAAALLLLANLAYYGWASGLLAPLGLAPAHEGEPERLMQQIAPQTLQVLPPGSAEPTVPGAASPAAAPEPPPRTRPETAPGDNASVAPQATQCLRAGPMDAARASVLREALARLPGDGWTLEPSELTGRWMVYVGRFADDEALARKRSELRALKVAFDRPGAALEPGLSLGRFSSEEAAQRALTELAGQGVRAARVVRERTSQTRYLLRVPAATPALRAELDALPVAWDDTPLQPCG